MTKRSIELGKRTCSLVIRHIFRHGRLLREISGGEVEKGKEIRRRRFDIKKIYVGNAAYINPNSIHCRYNIK